MTAQLSEASKKHNRKRKWAQPYVTVHSLIRIFWEAASLEGQQLHIIKKLGLVFLFDEKDDQF